jgi:hypothetical protein
MESFPLHVFVMLIGGNSSVLGRLLEVSEKVFDSAFDDDLIIVGCLKKTLPDKITQNWQEIFIVSIVKWGPRTLSESWVEIFSRLRDPTIFLPSFSFNCPPFTFYLPSFLFSAINWETSTPCYYSILQYGLSRNLYRLSS